MPSFHVTGLTPFIADGTPLGMTGREDRDATFGPHSPGARPPFLQDPPNALLPTLTHQRIQRHHPSYRSSTTGLTTPDGFVPIFPDPWLAQLNLHNRRGALDDIPVCHLEVNHRRGAKG